MKETYYSWMVEQPLTRKISKYISECANPDDISYAEIMDIVSKHLHERVELTTLTVAFVCRALEMIAECLHNTMSEGAKAVYDDVRRSVAYENIVIQLPKGVDGEKK